MNCWFVHTANFHTKFKIIFHKLFSWRFRCFPFFLFILMLSLLSLIILFYFFKVFAVRLVDRRKINVTAHLQYTDSNKPGEFSVDHVIDGDPRTAAGTCSCCGTVNSGGWIQLDLLYVYRLDYIVIQGRSDRKYIK